MNLCWNLSVLTLIIYYHMYFHLLPFCRNHFPPRSRAGRLLTRRQVTRIDTAGCGEAVEGPGWRCSTVIPSDLDGKCRHVGCPLVGKSVKFGEMVIYIMWNAVHDLGKILEFGFVASIIATKKRNVQGHPTPGEFCVLSCPLGSIERKDVPMFHNHLNDHRTNFRKSYGTAYDRRDPQFQGRRTCTFMG